MFTSKNSIQIKVGNGSYVDMGSYITEVKYNYPKLWANDTGRNLAGRMYGTLIGVFPKITLQFRKLTKDELEIIVPLLDAEHQTVKYYDPKKKTIIEMQTYAGDYEITDKRIISGGSKNEGFSVSLIAVSKRV